MKTPTYYLAAAALMFTCACSSSSTSTTGASTGGSSMTDASSAGTDMTSGTSSNPGGQGTNVSAAGDNQSVTSAASATGASGASDMTAFMGTFATMDDPTFMLTAASSNMLEIQMGQMATQKSTNADVKKFGQMMVDHHGKATQDWKNVATPMGVVMPTTLMPVHQAMMDKVMNKSGKQFDEAYMDAMETAHKMDVAMFEVKSKGAQTPTVQTFATKTLPMLRAHETMANKIEDKVD
ncbi:DUF4142 domain-containing protein [Hymenobacter sp. CRA2]|uniref:DUF4142 domain-containing protein n=1 Tax=Hymenobacter sp. CRA2 TaxID=1955620 RepID=UPI00098EE5E6|nr:DUF4142 domain-containing protein [Hymenobacter sp. CRA2]OON67380.1 hypothetical protein B0919_18105 [Hymenobacter sp. CRA2]